MHIFIGGILIIVIFTSTAINLKQDNLIFTDKRFYLEDKNIKQIDKNVINDLVENVSINLVKFRSLMSEKEKLIDNIKHTMDLHVSNHTFFNEDQITAFASFMKMHDDVNSVVSKNLSDINNNKYFVELKKELFQENPNYHSIYNEINQINNCQLNNIHALEQLIRQGNELQKII